MLVATSPFPCSFSFLGRANAYLVLLIIKTLPFIISLCHGVFLTFLVRIWTFLPLLVSLSHHQSQCHISRCFIDENSLFLFSLTVPWCNTSCVCGCREWTQVVAPTIFPLLWLLPPWPTLTSTSMVCL